MEVSLMQYEVMEALEEYIFKKYGCKVPEDEMLGICPHIRQPVWNKVGDRIVKHKCIPFGEMCSVEWFVAEVTNDQ